MNAEAEQMCLEQAQEQLWSALKRAKEAQEIRDSVPTRNRSEIIMSALAVHTWITDEFAGGPGDPDPPDVEPFKEVGRSEARCDPFLDTETILNLAERVDEHTRKRNLGIYGDAS